jgi:hypothetical protein
MINNEEDPKLPVSLLSKLFDATGSKDGANKGYFLFFINENGEPTLTSRTSNQCVQVALQRTIDIYNQEHLE